MYRRFMARILCSFIIYVIFNDDNSNNSIKTTINRKGLISYNILCTYTHKSINTTPLNIVLFFVVFHSFQLSINYSIQNNVEMKKSMFKLKFYHWLQFFWLGSVSNLSFEKLIYPTWRWFFFLLLLFLVLVFSSTSGIFLNFKCHFEWINNSNTT